MKRPSLYIARNATANIARGGATAVVALVLPHFLTGMLDKERFAAWSLMLQVAAYASYLDFGLQTAVARYLAQAIELKDDALRDKLISTVLALLLGAGLVAFLVIAGVAWQLPRLFHGVPTPLLLEIRVGLLLLGASSALQLPTSTFTGVMLGLRRNEYPALAIGISRLLGAAAVLAVVRYTHSLVWLALCLGGFSALGSVAQYALARLLLPEMQLRSAHLNMRIARDIGRYCSMLTFFSFSMLLITGLDVTIVGYHHFSSVGFYSIAATCATFFVGLNGSVVAALIAPVAVLQARGDYGQIRDVILAATRLSTYANLVLTIVAVLSGEALLRVWVGPSYARQALPILEILLVAQTFRLMGNVHSSALVATGLQRYALVPAIVEASTNVLFSIGGVLWLGPIGVALGTLVSAALAICIYVGYTVRQVKLIHIAPTLFVTECVLRPAICLAPMLIFSVCVRVRMVGPHWPPLLITSLLLTLLLTWFKGRVVPTHEVT